jgi:hypothetical protein
MSQTDRMSDVPGRSRVVKKETRHALAALSSRGIFPRTALTLAVESRIRGQVVQARSGSTRGTLSSSIGEVLRDYERHGLLRRFDRDGLAMVAVLDADGIHARLDGAPDPP